MITWMQRHRKYLVITIWISTIAFIGAGFVGWGQYSYGEKSGAVAKVGDVTISGQELQNTYAQLFNRYSQIFKGQFDQEQAKKFGLDKQALQQLINQALLVNLANSYHLEVSDKEVADLLQSQQAFFENGVFSKSVYQQVLKQNRMTPTSYEADLRKSLLIEKLLALFPATPNKMEKTAFETALGIADKIEYKILTDDMVTVDTSDKALKAYWETHKNDYLTPRSFKIAYIEQTAVDAQASDEELQAYYDAHKYDFAGADGKLLDFAAAKPAVVAAVNDKATNKEALKRYIAFKKEKLEEGIQVKEATVSENDTAFSPETLQAIASADLASPYLKPKKEGERYVIIKLVEIIAPEPKPYEEARADLLADYRKTMSTDAMLAMAKKDVNTFKGQTTEAFVKRTDTAGFEGLDEADTRELLKAVFNADKSYGIAGLQSRKMVLFRIVDQKIDASASPEEESAIAQAKTALLTQNLITALNQRYETQIFMKGFGQ